MNVLEEWLTEASSLVGLDPTTGAVSSSHTHTAYDSVGNVTAVTDARGAVTTYEYDKRNQQVAVVLPNVASGTATGTIEVTGRASHAGGAPDRGRNALIELAHQLLQTRDIAKSIPGTQLNWLVRYVPFKQYLTGPALASRVSSCSGAA